jgi:hypothetical protein
MLAGLALASSSHSALHPLLPEEPQTSCAVRASDPNKIAVLVFGDTCHLQHGTDDWIRNLYTPLSKLGQVDTFVHCVRTLRSDENGAELPPPLEQLQRLSPCRVVIEEQGAVDEEFKIETKARAMMRRLRTSSGAQEDLPAIMSLHRSRLSLYSTGLMLREYQKQTGLEYQFVVAARSDTELRTPLPHHASISMQLLLEPHTITVPSFAHGHATGGGVNDRFAMGPADKMLDVYARQWDRQLIPGMFRGADAEGLLCQHLAHQNVSLRAMPVCLVRVRLGGGALRRDFLEARSLPKCKGVTILRAENDLAQPCPAPPEDAVIPPFPMADSSAATALLERRFGKKVHDFCGASQTLLLRQSGPEARLPLHLVDQTYYTTVKHRAGWRRVVEGLITSGIATTDDAAGLDAALLVDCAEHYFLFSKDAIAARKGFGPSRAIKKPWVGIVHFPAGGEGKGRQHFLPQAETIEGLLNNTEFLASLPHCTGLVTLTSELRLHLKEQPVLAGTKIHALLHPIAPPGASSGEWGIDAFKAAWRSERQLVQLGVQDRMLGAIFAIRTTCSRAWLPGVEMGEPGSARTRFTIDRLRQHLEEEVEAIWRPEELSHHDVAFSDQLNRTGNGTWELTARIREDAVRIMRMGNEDYDRTLLTSVVMVPLLGGTANNAVLESISSNVPAFVSRLPSTEEYLGKDYPMFFDSLDEVSSVVEDEDRLFDLMERTHRYLLEQPKERLLPENFQFELVNVARGLRHECPEQQQPGSAAEESLPGSGSSQRPFFFFHIPKVGGTSLRKQLVSDAKRLRRDVFSPCFGGLPCSWWSEPRQPDCSFGEESNAMACAHSQNASRAAIFAGHFGTKLVASLRDGWKAAAQSLPDGSQTAWQDACTASSALSCANCLVMLRDPIDRLIDAYTFFDERSASLPFEQLPVGDLVKAVDNYGANVTLAYLGDGEYDPQDVTTHTKLPPSGGDMSVALATISHCSLGIFERWEDSQALWRAELPWSSVGVTEVRSQKGPPHITSAQLPAETRDLLRQLMAADVALYEYALQTFEDRLSVVATFARSRLE